MPVVVKVCVPDTLRVPTLVDSFFRMRTREDGLGPAEATRAILHELQAYISGPQMFQLQGKILPRLFGVGRVQVDAQSRGGSDRSEAWLAVWEDVGEPVCDEGLDLATTLDLRTR